MYHSILNFNMIRSFFTRLAVIVFFIAFLSIFSIDVSASTCPIIPFVIYGDLSAGDFDSQSDSIEVGEPGEMTVDSRTSYGVPSHDNKI